MHLKHRPMAHARGIELRGHEVMNSTSFLQLAMVAWCMVHVKILLILSICTDKLSTRIAFTNTVYKRHIAC
jgi:hypothetical protein